MDRTWTSFNGGEVSRLFEGRLDQAGYYTSARTMQNFIALETGPTVTRGGTIHVTPVKDSSKQVALIPFRYSDSDAYILEFGHNYMRVIRNRGLVTLAAVNITGATKANPCVVTATAHGFSNGDKVVISGVAGMTQINGREYTVANVAANTFELSGINSTSYGTYTSGGTAAEVYEIATSYTESDLIDADGICQLQWAQSADQLYLAHPSLRNRVVTRSGHTSWAIADFDPTGGGPFLAENETAVTMTYAGAETAGSTGTLTASSATFVAGHVGSYWMLRRINLSPTPPWQTGTAYTSGSSAVHNEGLFYTCTGSGTSGAEPPVHVEGSALDGPTGATWLFRHGGWCVVKVTGYTSSTVVNVTLVTDGYSFNALATTAWREGAWSSVRGFPRALCWYENRLIWASTTHQPQAVFLSASGDHLDYLPIEITQNVTDATAFTRELDAHNTILWLAPTDKGILLGTTDGEWLASTSNFIDPLTPSKATAKEFSRFGVAPIPPVRIGDEVLFAQRSRSHMRATRYSLDRTSVVTRDLNVRADHMFGWPITALAYQDEPHRVVWGVREDGVLVGATYNTEDEVKVLAWHRHPVGGTNAVVEHIAVIPSPSLLTDDVFLVVSRTIGGGTVRHIEYLSRPITVNDAIGDMPITDATLSYDGASTTGIGGLWHLEGQTVQVMTDGVAHPDCVVASGAITLDWAASVIHAGLLADFVLEPLPVELPPDQGQSLVGRKKRIRSVHLRIVNSLGGWIGPDTANMDRIVYDETDMDAGPDAFTGDVSVQFPGGFSDEALVRIEQRAPLPLLITQMTCRLEVSSHGT